MAATRDWMSKLATVRMNVPVLSKRRSPFHKETFVDVAAGVFMRVCAVDRVAGFPAGKFRRIACAPAHTAGSHAAICR